jgi:hypothetical protein
MYRYSKLRCAVVAALASTLSLAACIEITPAPTLPPTPGVFPMPSPRPTQPDATVTILCEGPATPSDARMLEDLCDALAARIASEMPLARVMRGGSGTGLQARLTLTSLRTDGVAGRLVWLREGAIVGGGADVGMDIMDAQLRRSHLDDFVEALLRASPAPG